MHKAYIRSALTIAPMIGLLIGLTIVSAIAICAAPRLEIAPGMALILKICVIAVLFGELVGLLMAMATFCRDEIFAAPEDRAKRLFDRIRQDETPDVRAVLDDNEMNDDERVAKLTALILRPATVFRDVRLLLFRILRLEARAIVSFVAATMLLEYVAHLAGQGPIFGEWTFDLRTLQGSLALFDHSLYFNLVTFSTVGYGDITPNNLIGRVLVEAAMVTSLVFLVFGINVFVAALLDSTSGAWQQREQLLRRSVAGVLTDRAALDKASRSPR